VIGGLFSSTILTLFLLPVLYGWIYQKEQKPEPASPELRSMSQDNPPNFCAPSAFGWFRPSTPSGGFYESNCRLLSGRAYAQYYDHPVHGRVAMGRYEDWRFSRNQLILSNISQGLAKHHNPAKLLILRALTIRNQPLPTRKRTCAASPLRKPRGLLTSAALSRVHRRTWHPIFRRFLRCRRS
jgi:hypothetical protein